MKKIKDRMIIMESTFFLLVVGVVVVVSSEDPMQGNFVYTYQILSAEYDCC